jgi:hypothetical protein
MDPMEQETDQVLWTDEALKRLENAPIFLRGMVKRLAEKKARQEAIGTITPDHLARWKNETMGSVEAPTEAGGLFWTKKAVERLDSVPEFMRGMVKRIAEDIARQGGHLEVNTELFGKVEALGLIAEEGPESGLPWTDGALKRLDQKVENAPSIAMDFVKGMLKRDAEDLAREKGFSNIDEEVLKIVWDAPLEEVEWSPEAWTRLQTSPDFVRSGIKKAAERRARKSKAKVITSDLLTQFRNEAMMKAVMRIRQLGFTELTFDAFDAAKSKVKRLKGNEQADNRLEEIRDYMTRKPHVGVLGEELMQRFRRYLKGEEKKLL